MDEKLAQAHKGFFRRETVLFESPGLRKPGKGASSSGSGGGSGSGSGSGSAGVGETCYAHVFAGFVLLLSDEKKLKFVEHIALSAATLVTIDLTNARRVTFTANFGKHGQGALYAVTCADEASARDWLADLSDARPEDLSDDGAPTPGAGGPQQQRAGGSDEGATSSKDKDKDKERKRKTLLVKK